MTEKRSYFWYFVIIYALIIVMALFVAHGSSYNVNYTNISSMYQEPREIYEFSQNRVTGTINGSEIVDLRIQGVTNVQGDFYGSDVFLQCLICIAVFSGFIMAFVFIIMLFLILRWWYDK